MYFADSDILSIILMLLTIGAGIYSSLAKGKKREDDSGTIEHEGKPSTFEELFGDAHVHYREEEDSIKEYEYEQENEYDCEKNEKYEECFTEGEEHEYEYEHEDYDEDNYVPCVNDVDDVNCMPECNMSDSKEHTFSDEHACSAGLKEKLKQSPKDMVLFSEIMKPKYKDF